jgi:hypothetical protein
MTAATSRIIQRALASTGPWTTITTVTPTATTYKDTSVTNGTEYFYRVIGVNAVGNSAPSNVASATPSSQVTYLLDTFTDTNGTLITAHTPDETSTGGSWSTSGSSVEAEIDSNQLQTQVVSSGSFSGASYELPSSTEDFTVTMEGNYQDDTAFVNMGLRVRGPEQLSLGAGYWVGFADNASDSLVIRSSSPNGTVLASTAMTQPADGEAFTLTVVVTGDTIDATWEDTTSGTVNVVYASATARDGDWVAPFARGINNGSYICTRIEVTSD